MTAGYNKNKQVTHVNMEACPKAPAKGVDAGVRHPVELLVAEIRLTPEDIIPFIDAGDVFWMIPTEGAPAYQAYKATGLPLMLQIRTCAHCGKRVLWA